MAKKAEISRGVSSCPNSQKICNARKAFLRNVADCFLCQKPPDQDFNSALCLLVPTCAFLEAERLVTLDEGRYAKDFSELQLR
jgi:hypothetical protein